MIYDLPASELLALVERWRLDLTDDTAPVILFDADETIWHADVGDDFFFWLVEQKAFEPEGLAAVSEHLERSKIVCQGDVMQEFADRYQKGHFHSLPAYEVMVRSMAGMRESAVQLWATDRAEAYLPGRIYAVMRECMAWAEETQFESHIVSGSNRWSVEAGARQVGLGKKRVHGVSLEVRAGVLQNRPLLPIPLGSGKAEVALTIDPRRPFLALGDSQWDIPMLEQARHRILVNPRPVAVELALKSSEQEWYLLHL